MVMRQSPEEYFDTRLQVDPPHYIFSGSSTPPNNNNTFAILALVAMVGLLSFFAYAILVGRK